eukprot:3376563-Ditylum_brightwellii.AAC.1
MHIQAFQGCSLCKLDAEDMVNMLRQALNHKPELCPFVGPHNIRIKNAQEVLMQQLAKHPPPKANLTTDIQRRTPV